MARAVDKNTLKRLTNPARSNETKASSQVAEELMKGVTERYYLPWLVAPSEAPFQMEAWTKGIPAFLCRMGRLVMKEKLLDDMTKSTLEDKLRKTLEVNCVGAMPSRLNGFEPRSQGSSQGGDRSIHGYSCQQH